MADGGLLEALSSVVAATSSLDVMLVEGVGLAAAVLQAEQLLNAANALSALLLERFEADGAWAADGALSAVAWTAERTGSARAGLRNRRRQGAALRYLPARRGAGPGAGECRRSTCGRSASACAAILTSRPTTRTCGSTRRRRWTPRGSAWRPATGPRRRPMPQRPTSSEPETAPNRAGQQATCLADVRRLAAGRRPASRPRTPTWSRLPSTPASTGRCGTRMTAIPASPADRCRRCGRLRSSISRRRRCGRSRPTPRCPTATASPSSCSTVSRRTRRTRCATPLPTGSLSAPAVRSSTSAGRPIGGRSPSAGRSPSEIEVVCSPAATGHRHGRISITASME